MRLNDPLVTSFSYEGRNYDLDLSFDNVLDVFDVLDDKFLRDYEKAQINVALLTNETIHGENAVALWNYMYEQFLSVESKQPIEYDLKGNPLPSKKQKQVINLEKDAEYIFASFQQAYNINLFQEQGKLHWHQFQALLNGLPKDTIMQKIIQIRLWEPSNGEPSEYKAAMRELQEVYSLENDMEEYPS